MSAFVNFELHTLKINLPDKLVINLNALPILIRNTWHQRVAYRLPIKPLGRRSLY